VTNLIKRAIARCTRDHEGLTLDQPSIELCSVEGQHVVLRGPSGELARHRTVGTPWGSTRLVHVELSTMAPS
jgi:hypothetical protein